MSADRQSGLFTAEAEDRRFSFDADPVGSTTGGAGVRRPDAGDGSGLCARLARYFSARPGQWIDGREIATVAGIYAWRSRVSDLRRPPYHFTIQNRQRREGRYAVSEYRFVAGPSDDPGSAA